MATRRMRQLCDVLSPENQQAFARSGQVTRYVMEVVRVLNPESVWPIQTAAMLPQIGCVILPQNVLTKMYRRQALMDGESQLYNQHPLVGGDLLRQIPRMKDVADIIAYQDKCFDGYGGPTTMLRGDQIPLGARILKMALDFDALFSAGHTQMDAYEQMVGRKD